MTNKLTICVNCNQEFENGSDDATWCPTCIKVEIDKMDPWLIKTWENQHEVILPKFNEAGPAKETYLLGLKVHLCYCGRVEEFDDEKGHHCPVHGGFTTWEGIVKQPGVNNPRVIDKAVLLAVSLVDDPPWPEKPEEVEK